MNQFPNDGYRPAPPGVWPPPQTSGPRPQDRPGTGQVLPGPGPLVPPRRNAPAWVSQLPGPRREPVLQIARNREITMYVLVTIGSLALFLFTPVGVILLVIAVWLAVEDKRDTVRVVVAASVLGVIRLFGMYGLYLEIRGLYALVLLVIVAPLAGLVWAYGRHRDLVPSALAASLGALVGLIIGVVALANDYELFVMTGGGVCLVSVLTAWVAAALCPRSSMAFFARPAMAPVRLQPLVVGHTADGRPVYTAPNTAMVSAGPNGLAIGAFVCSLTALSIVAVILGHLSMSQSRREGQSSSGLAIAGLILGYLTLVAQIVFVGLMVASMNGAF